MELQQLTDEQKAKLKELEHQTTKNSVKSGLKNALFLVLAIAAVNLLNMLYIHSDYFVAIGSAATGFLWVSMIKLDLKTQYDRVNEEVKKILEG